MMIIASLIAPFLLLLIETILPFPYIVEEAVKWLIIYVDKKQSYKVVILAGAAFTVSESIFYVNKIIMMGNFWLLPQRIFLTGMMHVITMLMMAWGIKQNKTVKMGTLIFSMVIHWGFNRLV